MQPQNQTELQLQQAQNNVLKRNNYSRIPTKLNSSINHKGLGSVSSQAGDRADFPKFSRNRLGGGSHREISYSASSNNLPHLPVKNSNRKKLKKISNRNNYEHSQQVVSNSAGQYRTKLGLNRRTYSEAQVGYSQRNKNNNNNSALPSSIQNVNLSADQKSQVDFTRNPSFIENWPLKTNNVKFKAKNKIETLNKIKQEELVLFEKLQQAKNELENIQKSKDKFKNSFSSGLFSPSPREGNNNNTNHNHKNSRLSASSKDSYNTNSHNNSRSNAFSPELPTLPSASLIENNHQTPIPRLHRTKRRSSAASSQSGSEVQTQQITQSKPATTTKIDKLPAINQNTGITGQNTKARPTRIQNQNQENIDPEMRAKADKDRQRSLSPSSQIFSKKQAEANVQFRKQLHNRGISGKVEEKKEVTTAKSHETKQIPLNPKSADTNVYEIYLDPEAGKIPETYPCPQCSRKFEKHRLAKHKKACKKLNSKNRKVFNVKEQRLEGTEHGKFIAENDFPRRKGKRQTDQELAEKDKIARATQKKKNWRETHNNLLEIIKAGREYQKELSEKQAMEKQKQTTKQQTNKPKPLQQRSKKSNLISNNKKNKRQIINNNSKELRQNIIHPKDVNAWKG